MADDPFWRSFRESRSNGLFRIIPNGIEPAPAATPSKSESYRKNLGLPPDALVVGSIGRMVHERRPDLLLDAFNSLSGRCAGDVQLVLGGDGPERAALAERLALGLAGSSRPDHPRPR
jgi:glycosyltransferase involved in cell wall biosynthesis